MTISVSGSIGGTVSSASVNSSASVSLTTGNNYITRTQNIGTVEEIIEIPADMIAGSGMVLIRNRDTTNFVEVGLTGSYPIIITAGGFAMFDANAQDIYVKADTAACRIEYTVIERVTTTTTTTTAAATTTTTTAAVTTTTTTAAATTTTTTAAATTTTTTGAE